MRIVGAEGPLKLDDDLLVHADNLDVLPRLPAASFDLIYIDPPFNTGTTRRQRSVAVQRRADGERIGFGGHRYATEVLAEASYEDRHADYVAFMEPRLREARRLLALHGTLYVHLDYREAHYIKVLLDRIFGRDAFLNEIVWAYDYGGKPRRRWPAKHDTILVYVRHPGRHHFNADAVEREPYMAPGLVTKEKAERGKMPTDCYSADTEILTRRGFVRFPALTCDDEVATVSPDHELVYDHPVKLHAGRIRGHMLELRSETIDLLVTPTHSLYVRPKHRPEYYFLSAQDLADEPSSSYGLPNQLTWRAAATAQPRLRVPSVVYEGSCWAKPLPSFDMGDWLEFMGRYLAEGWAGFCADRAIVSISQHKRPEGAARLRQLIGHLGLDHRYDGRRVIISNTQLAAYLSGLGRSHERFIPRWMLQLGPELLLRLCDGLMLGDEYRRRGGPRHAEEWSYVTTSPQLASDVQELWLKLGYNATVAPRADLTPAWRPQLSVRRGTAPESTIWPRRHRRLVPYDGMVYCATVVPYHTLVVRRNGRLMVSGNCWWHTIVPTAGAERTGYPTQKPEGIVRRMVGASSRPGGWCLDFFAGSGTLGAVARELGRRFVLVDSNPKAIETAAARLTPKP